MANGVEYLMMPASTKTGRIAYMLNDDDGSDNDDKRETVSTRTISNFRQTKTNSYVSLATNKLVIQPIHHQFNK